MKDEPEDGEHDEAADETSMQAITGVDPILSGPLLRGTPAREHSPPPRPKRTQSELPEPISLSPAHAPHHEETHSDDEDYEEIPEPALSVRDPLPSFPFDPPPSSASPQLALTPLGPLPPPSLPPRRDRPADPRSPRPARRQAARTRGASPAKQRSIPPPKELAEEVGESRLNEATDADVSRSDRAPDRSEGHRSIPPIGWLLFSAIVGIGGFELGLSKGRSETAQARIVEVPVETSQAPAAVAPPADVATEAPTREAASPPATETAVATEAPSATAAPTSSTVVADAPTATATALAPTPASTLTGSLPTSAPPPTATAIATASAAPTSLSGGADRTAVASAMARSAGAVAGCPADTDGSLTVTVTFLPSGAVGSTSSSGSLAGTQTAACVERLFGVAHIPPYEGDPITTSTTVSLKAH